MYRFKQIKARCSFVSEVIKPSGECSVFSKIEQIEVLPNLVEGLNFTFRGATQELIDGIELKDFDLIMSRLGKSIYPIELNVLKNGHIKRLKNYTDIQTRWNKECKNILSMHKNAYWVERYINITSKSVNNENSCTNVLKLNNFIQLLFIDEGALKQRFTLCDFPFGGNKTELEFELATSNANCYCYYSKTSDMGGRGEMIVRYTEKGLPENIEFKYLTEVANEGMYRKQISIKLIDKK